MEFTTKVGNGDISQWAVHKFLGLNTGNDIDDFNAKAVVKWHIEIEAREWGIKGISVFIDHVEIECEVEYYDIEDLECEDKIYKSFEIDSTDFAVIDKIEIDSDSICPEEIEIDFEKKTITVL